MNQVVENSLLYSCLNAAFPSFKKIQTLLGKIDPEEVSNFLDEQPNAIFTIDYYFRLYDPAVGGRIINHKDFSMKNLKELFSCQLIQFYLKFPDEEIDVLQYDNILGSYWGLLEKERLLSLFKDLIHEGSNSAVAAYLILKNLNHEDLYQLEVEQSREILEFFKRFRKDFKRFLIHNIELFDFIHKLAREQKDEEYLEFLNQYTSYAINLRFSEDYSDEIAEQLDENEKVPLNRLVDMIKDLNDELCQLTLEIMVSRGLISENIMIGILRLKK